MKKISLFLQQLWQWRITLVLLFLLGIILALFLSLNTPSNFPIQTVKVYGSYPHVRQIDVVNIVKPLAGQGFFAVDLPLIRYRLLHLPWVSDVHIRRLWPHALSVRIIEKAPIARWNGTGLITREGKIFYPRLTTIPQYLPILEGDASNNQLMLDYFSTLYPLFKSNHLSLKKIQLSPQYSWRITLDNGTYFILGSEDVLARAKRAITVYNELMQKQRAIEYVDMRYSHGAAVKWG